MLRTKIKSIAVVIISVMAVLAASVIILRLSVFELLTISGDSMSSTIRHGDRILVNKLAYKFGEPRRGDIIAIEIGRKIIVKRVIGLPGDVIEVKEGMLYRSGEAVIREPYVNPSRRSSRPRAVKGKHVFVMGDNRPLSMDSRDFGTIAYQNIIGKAIFIYFPPRRMGRLKME